jgi:UDPglucose--hexose-1-phosphate uridylyltransferase
MISMQLRFQRSIVEARLAPPGAEQSEAVHRIEIRADPLTGRKSRINVERVRRPRQVSLDHSLMKTLAAESEKGCPFCPENVERATPTFTNLPYRRLRLNDCLVFPNLYPFTKHHAVTVFTSKHFVPLEQMEWRELRDGIACSIQFLRDLSGADPQAKYWYISWNYLPPSGASIIHPHFQVLADVEPTTLLRLELEASRRFREETGLCYWDKLLRAEEEAGERFLARGRTVAWLASFAPIGNREVLAIFEGKPSLASLDDADVEEFARGLAVITRYYAETGVTSLNMALYSAPLEEGAGEYFYLHARVISRPAPTQLYVNDDGFMEKLNWEPVIDTLPEELAESLRMNERMRI